MSTKPIPLCDACNERITVASHSGEPTYMTDDEVCGGSDGPGFFLCTRPECGPTYAAMGVEERRALFTAARAKRIPKHPPAKAVLYVNAYAVTRHYGGPEEGGWWYNVGAPLASVPLPATRETLSEVEADVFRCSRAHWNRPELGIRYVEQSFPADDWPTDENGERIEPLMYRYTYSAKQRVAHERLLGETLGDVSEGNIYSVLGGVAVEMKLEDHFARPWRDSNRYE